MTSIGRGRKSGDQVFSKQMVDTLLDIVDKVLPTDDREWEVVAEEFNSLSKSKIPRGATKVKDKFGSLQKPLRSGSGGNQQHQRALSIEEKIRNKLGSITYSSDMSIDSLSPAQVNYNKSRLEGCCSVPIPELSPLTPSPPLSPSSPPQSASSSSCPLPSTTLRTNPNASYTMDVTRKRKDTQSVRLLECISSLVEMKRQRLEKEDNSVRKELSALSEQVSQITTVLAGLTEIVKELKEKK